MQAAGQAEVSKPANFRTNEKKKKSFKVSSLTFWFSISCFAEKFVRTNLTVMADTRRCFWVSLQDMSKKFNEYLIQKLLRPGFKLIILWQFDFRRHRKSMFLLFWFFCWVWGWGQSIFQIDFCKQIACIRFFWHSCSNEGSRIWAAFLNSPSPPPSPSLFNFSVIPQLPPPYHPHPFSHPQPQ